MSYGSVRAQCTKFKEARTTFQGVIGQGWNFVATAGIIERIDFVVRDKQRSTIREFPDISRSVLYIIMWYLGFRKLCARQVQKMLMSINLTNGSSLNVMDML